MTTSTVSTTGSTDGSTTGTTAAASPRVYDEHWLGGRWERAHTDDTIAVEDPSTERTIALVPAGTARDVDRAVAAARAAFPGWAATPVRERLRYLSTVVERLRARAGELADTITAEVGAPLETARRAQVGLAIAMAESFVDIGGAFAFERRVGNSLVLREPAGVVAAITPWNVPLLLTMQKLAPALVAGCTVVLKPSELTPLHARVLAEVLADADLPPGVVNVVFGTGPAVGAALAEHPDVDLISLTGSTRAGRDVAARAAGTLKRVHLELGGKNASIVLDDADLATAVRATVDQMCFNTGQTCLQWSRLLVPRHRQDEALELASAAATGYRVGDPRDPATDLGPLISRQAAERVRSYVRRGVQDGARLVAGGPDRPAEPAAGHYVVPTVFGDVTPDMAIAREEIFGPVLSVLPYDGEDEAVRVANDTPYGLHGSVWSASTEHATAVARRLRTGLVDVNGGQFNVAAPFGGMKQSGIGRECGAEGLDGFCEIKSLQLPEDGAALTGPRLRGVS